MSSGLSHLIYKKSGVKTVVQRDTYIHTYIHTNFSGGGCSRGLRGIEKQCVKSTVKEEEREYYYKYIFFYI